MLQFFKQPFLDIRNNPSFLVASALPSTHIVTRIVPGGGNGEGGGGPASNGVKTTVIHIHSRLTPLDVSYAYVDETIPSLLFSESPAASDSDVDVSRSSAGGPGDEEASVEIGGSSAPKPNFDVTLNIGLAPGTTCYALETQAHRDGYTRRDVEGQLPRSAPPPVWLSAVTPTTEPDPALESTDDSSPLPASTSADPIITPAVLTPTFDMPTIYRHWNDAVHRLPTPAPHAPVKTIIPHSRPIALELSTDAGRYLCEYTLYACLAEYWKHSSPTSKAGATANVDTAAAAAPPEAAGAAAAKEGGPGRPCLFLHVPSGDAAEGVKRGVHVVLGLLEAVAICAAEE